MNRGRGATPGPVCHHVKLCTPAGGLVTGHPRRIGRGSATSQVKQRSRIIPLSVGGGRGQAAGFAKRAKKPSGFPERIWKARPAAAARSRIGLIAT